MSKNKATWNCNKLICSAETKSIVQLRANECDIWNEESSIKWRTDAETATRQAGRAKANREKLLARNRAFDLILPKLTGACNAMK